MNYDFVTQYTDYAKILTDAPKEFHYFVALGILSAVVGSKVFLPFGAQNIYPNLWIVLLAPSSYYRKSTCLALGSRIIRGLNEELILPDEFSRERLVENLSLNPQGLFVWSEFASVMSNVKRDYMSGTIEMLTNLYDCPPVYKKVLKNEVHEINQPCLAIMAGSTIEWFVSCFKEGEIRGGFLPRFLYVAPSNKNGFMPIPPSYDVSREHFLRGILEEIVSIKGMAKIGKEAQTKYTDWIRKHEAEITMTEDENLLSGFWTRLETYVLKMAILYSLSANRSLEIDIKSLEKAIKTVEAAKGWITKLIREDFSFNQETANRKKVLSIIKREPGIRYAKLLQKSHLGAKQVKAILETLREAEQVCEETDGRTKAYFANE